MSMLIEALARASREKEMLAANAEGSVAPSMAPVTAPAVDAAGTASPLDTPVLSFPALDIVLPQESPLASPTIADPAPLEFSLPPLETLASATVPEEPGIATTSADLESTTGSALAALELVAPEPTPAVTKSPSMLEMALTAPATPQPVAEVGLVMTSEAEPTALEEPAPPLVPSTPLDTVQPVTAETTPSVKPEPPPAAPTPEVKAIPTPQVARAILDATVKPRKPRVSRRLVALAAVAVIGIGINLWIFVRQPEVPLGLMPAAPPPLAPAAPSKPASAVPPAPTSEPEPSLTSTATVAEAPKRRTVASKPMAAPTPSTGDTPSVPPASVAKPRIVTRVAEASPLDRAYQALLAGRNEEADAFYRQALAKNAGEIDALIGLAYLARQQEQNDAARGYFRQILRLQPQHPGALAGLLELGSDSDVATNASRARELTERHPDSAPALAALGALMVKGGRIAEAQQAYFKALTLEPDNAFHAYNLAVALDRMHKSAQAEPYYQRALQLIDAMPTNEQAAFPRQAAAARLDELRQGGAR